jgi:FtsH-binding integral membrane protein
MHILIGLIGVILSFLILIYREQIRGFMGTFGWAERYFGAGGTYTALMIAGVAVFFISLIIMTNTLDFLVGGFFGQFFGSTK